MARRSRRPRRTRRGSPYGNGPRHRGAAPLRRVGALGVPFTGQPALPVDFLEAVPGLRRHHLFLFRRPHGVQSRCRRRFSGASRAASASAFAHALPGDDDGLPMMPRTRTTGAPEAFDFAAGDLRPDALPRRTTCGTCRPAASCSATAGSRQGCWTTGSCPVFSVGDCRGTPTELARSAISGRTRKNRSFRHVLAGNASPQQPRFYVNGDAQSAANVINTDAFAVPGINDARAVSEVHLRNPGFRIHDPIGFQEPSSARTASSLQFRPRRPTCSTGRSSGVNRTTNVTNAAGQTCSNIFTNFSGPSVTNNARPAETPRCSGRSSASITRRATRASFALGVKLYF